PEGEVTARVSRELGPELRARAQRFWEAGAADEARGLYRLVLAMDPADETARARAAAGAQPGPAPRPAPKPVVVAAAPVQQDAGVPQLANAVVKDDKKEERERRRSMKEAPTTPEIEPGAKGNPEESKRLAREAAAAIGRGRLADAEQLFQRAVRADSGNAEAIFGIAEVNFERARYAEALDYGRRAARLSPKSARYHLLCGDAYYKLLRYEDALGAWRRALGLRPGDAAIQKRIESLERKLGR
ncbi:MAG TPA: tetratricopeptide repeat protein, partial [Polyangia bacterium]